MRRLESQYTNYGCYCWIDGIDVGVIGGGIPKDKVMLKAKNNGTNN